MRDHSLQYHYISGSGRARVYGFGLSKFLLDAGFYLKTGGDLAFFSFIRYRGETIPNFLSVDPELAQACQNSPEACFEPKFLLIKC